MSLIGPAHPSWKTGRYSKLLPRTVALGAHYADAEENPRLLSLRSDIALCEAQLRALLAQIGDGKVTPEASWPRMESLMEERRKLTETEAKAMERLHRMVTLDEVRAFGGRLVMILGKYEKDAQILAAVGREIRALQVTGSESRTSGLG
jgi:hypothetical protein